MNKHKIIIWYLNDHLEWTFNVLQSVLNLSGKAHNAFLSPNVWMLHDKFSMVKTIGKFTQAAYKQTNCKEFRTIDWTNHLDWLKDFYNSVEKDFVIGNYDSRQIDMIIEYLEKNDIPYQTIAYSYTEKEFPALVKHTAECQIHRVDYILPFKYLALRDHLWRFLPREKRMQKYQDYYSKIIPSSVAQRDTDVKFDFARILDKSAVKQYVHDLGFTKFSKETQEYYDTWRELNKNYFE